MLLGRTKPSTRPHASCGPRVGHSWLEILRISMKFTQAVTASKQVVWLFSDKLQYFQCSVQLVRAPQKYNHFIFWLLTLSHFLFSPSLSYASLFLTFSLFSLSLLFISVSHFLSFFISLSLFSLSVSCVSLFPATQQLNIDVANVLTLLARIKSMKNTSVVQ